MYYQKIVEGKACQQNTPFGQDNAISTYKSILIEQYLVNYVAMTHWILSNCALRVGTLVRQKFDGGPPGVVHVNAISARDCRVYNRGWIERSIRDCS